MLVHLVLIRWKGGVNKTEVNNLVTDVKKLKNKIDVIIDIYAGENFSQWNDGYTHAIVVMTKNKKDLDT